jgi:hypothetical protein
LVGRLLVIRSYRFVVVSRKNRPSSTWAATVVEQGLSRSWGRDDAAGLEDFREIDDVDLPQSLEVDERLRRGASAVADEKGAPGPGCRFKRQEDELLHVTSGPDVGGAIAKPPVTIR